MYLLKEQSSHSRLHKVTTETGVPTARMFPKKTKIMVQIEEKLRISEKWKGYPDSLSFLKL